MKVLKVFTCAILLAAPLAADPPRAEPPVPALDGALAPGWTQADEDLLVPVWLGDDDRGALV